MFRGAFGNAAFGVGTAICRKCSPSSHYHELRVKPRVVFLWYTKKTSKTHKPAHLLLVLPFFVIFFLFLLLKLACLSPPSGSSSALYLHRKSLFRDVRSVSSIFFSLSNVVSVR